MRHQTLATETSRTVAAIRGAFAEFQITPARPDEVAEAQAFAARLIGGKIVSPDTLAWVHKTTGAGLFLVREDGELTGLFAMVLLTVKGRQAVWDDAFDSLTPPRDHVIGPGEEPAGLYGWGIAATNHAAAQRLIEACGLLGREAAPHLPVFARPVTPAGLRLMIERLKFKPVPGSVTGLVWTEPANQKPATAAAA